VDAFCELSLCGGPIAKAWNYVRLWLQLRLARFDTALVLEANHWSRRPELFLRSTGIPLVLAPCERKPKVYRKQAGPLPHSQHIADELLSIVSRLGIRVPAAGVGEVSLPRTSEERRKVDAWLSGNDVSTEALMIAVAPGTNMPAKKWPTQRFGEVVASLLKSHDLIPIVVGGKADIDLGRELVASWGRGVIAAGQLNVREGIELLSRCVLFLGNDTGTMHMAVTAGTPVVAVFAATDMPGRWDPYGPGNKAFRLAVSCEGCLLRVCVSEGMRCLLGISVEEVAAVCRDLLTRPMTGAA
jgi:ADP-heptose:LPS heptosyltransferase